LAGRRQKWRRRPIQQSLSVAHKTGGLATRDLERVVDTTVQPKAIAHPTDARLCHRALEKLVDLARRYHVPFFTDDLKARGDRSVAGTGSAATVS